MNHGKHEYVRGKVHTNTIEGFWSLLKRGIVGTFHQVGKEYLPLYVNEFAFRHNHREDPDIFRGSLFTRVADRRRDRSEASNMGACPSRWK